MSKFLKNNAKKYLIIALVIFLLAIIVYLAYSLNKNKKQYKLASENVYNNNFYELVDYVKNVESYLAKSTISTNSEYEARTLTYLWREANLAQVFLASLPIQSQELENTEKFLNQVSDYSYTLSRKNIEGQDLSDEEIKNLEELHKYSIELSNTLNQLSTDLNNGSISWEELTKSDTKEFAQEVSSRLDVFSSMEENFHEYEGLIYDGAFSEHLTNSEVKGLTGEEIDEEQALKIAKEFVGEDKVKEATNLGISENANIEAFRFSIISDNDKKCYIAISKKGGHIVASNCNRDITEENLSFEDASKKGLEFLEKKGFKNMKETYYLKEQGVLTINYAYTQDNVVIYPDLIKVKVALDNGEIMGIETTGYLNNHIENRDISKIKISKNNAKKELNKDLNIQSEGMAVIPTKFKTEILCYEFKGKVEDTDFLIYVNAENGKQEDILIITDTPNGVLTL